MGDFFKNLFGPNSSLGKFFAPLMGLVLLLGGGNNVGDDVPDNTSGGLNNDAGGSNNWWNIITGWFKPASTTSLSPDPHPGIPPSMAPARSRSLLNYSLRVTGGDDGLSTLLMHACQKNNCPVDPSGGSLDLRDEAPEFRLKVALLFKQLDNAGFKGQYAITSGCRTNAEQATLWANRASNPNPVAVPGTSAHEARADGGHAMDIDYTGSGGKVERQRFYNKMQSIVADLGIFDPETRGDPVHVQDLGTRDAQQSIAAAAANKQRQMASNHHSFVPTT